MFAVPSAVRAAVTHVDSSAGTIICRQDWSYSVIRTLAANTFIDFPGIITYPAPGQSVAETPNRSPAWPQRPNTLRVSSPEARPLPGATTALVLLLAINLFNYIDRQVLSAVLPKLELDATLFTPGDPNLEASSGC